MLLSRRQFVEVLASTPLVSIDLVVSRSDGCILLGRRLNAPAKGFWFVPGGRIFKGETLERAFKRTTLNELGAEIPYSQAKMLGAFDHLYDDNVFEEPGVSTHYVALGHLIHVEEEHADFLCNDQHEQYTWWDVETLLQSELVHDNTKAYFRAPSFLA